MKELDPSELKPLRESLRISQKKFSEMAGVSLATLRSIEFGTRKAQARTWKRIVDLVQKLSDGSLKVAPSPAVGVSASNPTGRRRGRPKGSTNVAAAAKPITSRPTPQPLALSNLDLELISRILGLTAEEKVDLLKQIM